jgi:hypothetical protein
MDSVDIPAASLVGIWRHLETKGWLLENEGALSPALV